LAPDPLLMVSALNFRYGKAQALHDVSLVANAGEIVALVGRNGAGKSTTMRILCGLLAPTSGSVRLRGAEIGGLPAYAVARRGVAFVPEDRQVFPNLTTKENLAIAAMVAGAGKFSMPDVFDIFPQLAAKSGTLGENLSGGEQQMLSIARALLTNPTLLLLDEPTEGLAPVVVQSVVEALRNVNRAGVALLLVEQNFKFTSALADRQYVMDSGRILWSGTTGEFQTRRDDVERLLLA